MRAFAFTFPWGLSCESVSAQGPVASPADIACPVRIAAHHACGAVGKRSGQPLAAAAGRTTGTASPAGVRRRAAVAGPGFFGVGPQGPALPVGGGGGPAERGAGGPGGRPAVLGPVGRGPGAGSDGAGEQGGSAE